MPFLALLTSKTGLLTIGAGLIALIIVVQTLRLNHAKADLESLRAADKAAAAHAKVVETVAARISAEAAKQGQQQQAEIVTRYKTLIKKVPVYVTAKDDADCRVPDRFVELWNSGHQDPAVPGVPR